MLERLFDDVSHEVAVLLDRALDGRELSAADAETLLLAQGPDLHALLRAADVARRADKGDDVTYVVCRNINFTNVCYVGCSFCGFARHREEADAYDHPMQVLLGKCRDAVARGATEVCIQGGIHPSKDHTHYREILETIKAEFPQLHIHAFSPEEIDFGHRKSGMPLAEYLRWLVDAGLGTMPGTAAEILDDEVRKILSPNKIGRERWIEIVTTAHEVGLRSTSTLMYGHIEKPHHVAAPRLGQGAGDEGEQDQRQGRGRLHGGDHQRRAALLRHDPGGRDRIDPGADVAGQDRQPHGPKAGLAQRVPGARGSVGRTRGHAAHHDQPKALAM